VAEDVDIEVLATLTAGYSGAEVNKRMMIINIGRILVSTVKNLQG
jgi:hypothetical protein